MNMNLSIAKLLNTINNNKDMNNKTEFETFREIDKYTQNILLEEAPSCFNGIVSVKKYKITIEEIKEPDGVIIDRLIKLRSNSTNSHDLMPLREAAAEYGVKL